MIVTFSGGSDDIVSTGIGKSIAKLKRDESYKRRFSVATPGRTRGVTVHACYDGCWSFAYGLLDEGARLPPWAFTVEHEHSYSTRLVIDTVDDLVELVEIGDDE